MTLKFLTPKTYAIIGAMAALLTLLACATAHAATFNVKDYGAVGNGTTDDTKAIQSAVDAAIKAGAGNTVLIPAGTFLVGKGPLDIEHSQGLTLTGAGVDRTMIWYTRTDANFCHLWHNTDVTVENFSSDCQRLPNGEYDLGETQGTITAIDPAARQVTVRIEKGYPRLNRPDIQNAPTANGWSKPFYTLSDPDRADFDGNQPFMQKVEPSADGTTAVITLNYLPSPFYVGEQWMIWIGPGPIWLDAGYGDDGTTTFRNLHYYGGADNYAMGDVSGSGKLIFDKLYCGAPAYQPDRMLTCDEGWQGGGRYAFTVTDSTFLKTWDDVFDFGSGDTTALSQPAPNQIIIAGTGDYRVGDLTELADDTTPPTGTYGKSEITAVSAANGKTTITLRDAVTLHHLGKDRFADISQAGSVTAIHDTFHCAMERHVYWRSGTSVVVTGCRFLNVPLVLGGWDNSEVPSDVRNIKVTGCTFLNSSGLTVMANGGSDTAPCGSSVIISGNQFLSSGRLAPDGGTDSIYSEGQPLSISNVTGATITGNVFDNNWGTNISLQNDADVHVSGNTFLHPNEIHPTWASARPDDASVIWLSHVSGASLSNNLVYGAGPFTDALVEAAQEVTGATGLSDGLRDPAAPTAGATPKFGTVTVSWTPVPQAAGYSVSRAARPAGPYAILASGLTTGPYRDVSAPPGRPSFYVVTAQGLPGGSRRSPVVWAAPNTDSVPVNLAAAYTVAGIYPERWKNAGAQIAGDSAPDRPASPFMNWHGSLFTLAPSAVSDAGQRIMLPAGSYSRLLLLADYVGSAAAATFQPTLTYADGSYTSLSLRMTNSRSPARQPGEAEAAVFGQGSRAVHLHGYVAALDAAKGVAWLTLPKTGTFHLLAMDLAGTNHPMLARGESLLPGQYLVSPDGRHFLVQQADGNLVLGMGSDPQHAGAVIWESGYHGSGDGPYFTTMQDDGNLVTYTGTPGATPHQSQYAVWSAGMNNRSVTGLRVTDAPQVQVRAGATVIWQKP